jgi:maleamate amidohydrolase
VFRSRLPALEMLRRGSEAVRVDRRLAPEPVSAAREAATPAPFSTRISMPADQPLGSTPWWSRGLTTSGCVRATVVDGLQNDFWSGCRARPWAIATPKAHAANLHDMHAKYAEVVSLDATLEALAATGRMHESRTPASADRLSRSAS